MELAHSCSTTKKSLTPLMLPTVGIMQATHHRVLIPEVWDILMPGKSDVLMLNMCCFVVLVQRTSTFKSVTDTIHSLV